MTNPMLEQFTKVMADGLQMTQGIRDEMATVMKDQAEKLFANMNVANTEQVEALKAHVVALEARIAALEATGHTH